MTLPDSFEICAITNPGLKRREVTNGCRQNHFNTALVLRIKLTRMPWAGILFFIASLLGYSNTHALEITLAGQYDTNDFSRYTRVALAGNYAYVAAGVGGVHVFNVSQPANPVRVGSFATGGETWDIALSGNYAFVASDNKGLQVLNISNPASPQFVGGYTNIFSRVIRVTVSGNYAYAVMSGGQIYGHGLAMQIFDISNPAQPIPKGFQANPESASGYFAGGAVVVKGNNVYFGWGRVVEQEGYHTTGNMDVFNVGDPMNPILIGTYYMQYWLSDIAISGNAAYVAFGSVSSGLSFPRFYRGGLVKFDITNPSALAVTYGYYTNAPASGVGVSGNQIILTGSSPRFLAFDLSNPNITVPSGGFQTPGYARGVAYSNNYAYVADDMNGLQILCVDCPRLSAELNFNEIQLSWSINFSNYVLQSSSNLPTPNWQAVNETPQVIGGRYSLSLPATNSVAFFRLVAQ